MFSKVLVILLIAKCIFANTSSICARVPEGHFVRSSVSCNSFNRCDNGQPIHGMCPRGFSFHPTAQTCSHNIDVDCLTCSPYGIQNIPHPDDCSMYYRCTNGVRTTMKCSDQLLFDRYFGDCNYAQRVICEPRNAICEQFRQLDWLGAIKIGNPLDCSSFYYCISGRAIESICPSGLFFNAYTATCEVMDTVNYCQGIGPIITTPLPEITTREYMTTPATTKTTMRVIKITNPTTTVTTTDATTTTRATTTTTTTTTTETTTDSTTTTETSTEALLPEAPTTTTTEATLQPEPVEPSTPCPAGVTGYFPMAYPDNCTRYYYCSRGVQRYFYTCTSGLFFTPGNNQCTADVPPGCEYLVE